MKKKLYYFMILLFGLFVFFGHVYSQNVNDSLSDLELNRFYGVTPSLLSIHLEIGAWYAEDQIIISSVSLLQNMKYYADIDILAYLKTVVYPQTSLENFLNRMDNMMKLAVSFSSYLDDQKQKFVQDKSKCDDAKLTSDKNFSLAMKDMNSASIEKYLNLSISNEKCSVEDRIMYNAYEKIQTQIKYYYDILKKKYNYFYGYKYDVLNSL